MDFLLFAAENGDEWVVMLTTFCQFYQEKMKKVADSEC